MVKSKMAGCAPKGSAPAGSAHKSTARPATECRTAPAKCCTIFMDAFPICQVEPEMPNLQSAPMKTVGFSALGLSSTTPWLCFTYLESKPRYQILPGWARPIPPPLVTDRDERVKQGIRPKT